jgi:WD40 repeat protein
MASGSLSGWSCPAVGRDRSGASPLSRPGPDRQHRSCRNGGVQTRWAHAGQRQPRRHHLLWGLSNTARPRLLGQAPRGIVSVVQSVAFSPGGQTLASGSADGAVRLWDATDPARPRPLGQPLTGGTTAVASVAFSRSGHTLASDSLDGTVRLWDLSLRYAIQRICATAGGLTPGSGTSTSPSCGTSHHAFVSAEGFAWRLPSVRPGRRRSWPGAMRRRWPVRGHPGGGR